ncbi:MAG TPA: hypothetical protein VFW93_06305 [Aquabacterium sp.]|uniref:hypothetical protein n=1 Tax=Aquabacterium sp. TaxID=1872578 RepID=UPI002E34D6C6|nr:hypothetical protein [Aquabacterium sp.]HEX5355808.1 hypothetical protein [Aquabacterium sp.]
MHTPNSLPQTSSELPTRALHAGAARWAATTIALALAGLLHACGGGGGGGGSSEAAGSANSGSAPTSTWPFPIGMSLASPAALASASNVVAGGLGIDNLGLSTTMTPQQAVLSSQADAIATGRLSLSGSGLVNVSALFDTSARSHASCYGQTVAYTNHDNASGTNGTLPSGEVAIWRATDNSSTPQACAAAEVSAQTQGFSAQTHQAVLLMAAMRQLVAANTSVALPAAGGATDVTSRVSTLLTPLLSGTTVQSATVSLNADSSEYTYRLQLTRGSGTSAQSLEISMLHTPADTDLHYAGTLRIALGYLSTDASIGCADQIDSGTSRYKVARLVSVGYNRQDQWLSLRLRAGQYCGNATGSNQFEALAATVMSGELDPAVYLAGSVRGSTLGWRQGFVRMGNDVLASAQTSDFILAWQDQPLGGASRARLFAGHSSLDSGTQARSLALFHGYTNDISITDGTMMGMVCNWNGPGSTRTLQNAFQYQALTLGSSATGWTLGTSSIAYAPTNSCSASNSMSFDTNGDGTLSGAEGQGFTSGLAVPSGSNDVQDELQQQGFLAPVLLL